MKQLSDCNLILNYLKDGEWHNAAVIMSDLKPGCYAWALRSRISNLRQRGYIIESRIGYNKLAEYRIIYTPPVEPGRPLIIRDYKTEQLNLFL